MKAFLREIGSSIWSPQFYATLESYRVRDGVRHLLSLSFIIAFISAVIFSIVLLPSIFNGIKAVSNLVTAEYPEDLIVTFDQGVASTQTERVYTFAIPRQFWTEGDTAKLNNLGIVNFAVIDTRKNFENAGQFQSAKTLFLLTKDSFVTYKEGGGYEYSPIPKEMKFTVTKPLLVNWVSKIVPLSRVLIPFAIVFGLAGLFLMNFVFYFLVALFAFFLMYIVALLRGRTHAYKTIFVSALYAVTAVFILNTLLWVGGFLFNIAFLYAVLLTVLVWVINAAIWKKPQLPTLENTPPPVGL